MDFSSEHPPSLAQLFEPPKDTEDYIGHFGWVCGYSADPSFINDAAERFTGRIKRRRAADGEVALALILDPGNPRLAMKDVPGVLHLPLPEQRRFALMHAKVALLGFRQVKDADAWRLRLIVSTGNWTRETLEESLDLAWAIEIGRNELRTADARQRAADLKAAWGFMTDLRALVGPSALDAASKIRVEAMTAVDQWMAEVTIAAPKRIKSRFIDSRTRALLPQIVERIPSGRRNYLAMGSGFYEGGNTGGALPQVPASVVEALRQKGYLTNIARIDLYVNPKGCQAVASAMGAIKERGWIVRRPGQGQFRNARRTLHAKFLFGASELNSSYKCLNAWLYFGSGNLTKPGLILSAPEGGNLEAGVVLLPDQLLWSERKGKAGVPVTKVLPLDFDDVSEIAPEDASAGSDMPEREPAYLPPPVPYFRWESAADGGGRLIPPEGNQGSFDVLGPDGEPRSREAGSVIWPDAIPSEVTVAWDCEGTRRTEQVPVIDEHGRIAALPLQPVKLEEAWALLSDFPMPPAEDPSEEGEDEQDNFLRESDAPSAAGTPGSYAIRRVMELIERIAARQTELRATDWTAWCVRLGQTLEQTKDDPDIAAFRELKLNPLSSLRAEPFRPDFAVDRSTDAGRLYEVTLDRIDDVWGVAHLEPMGVQNAV